MIEKELKQKAVHYADNHERHYSEYDAYIAGANMILQSAEYKQMEADAKSWKALEEKLTDCNLTLHDKGKSIELIVNRK